MKFTQSNLLVYAVYVALSRPYVTVYKGLSFLTMIDKIHKYTNIKKITILFKPIRHYLVPSHRLFPFVLQRKKLLC